MRAIWSRAVWRIVDLDAAGVRRVTAGGTANPFGVSTLFWRKINQSQIQDKHLLTLSGGSPGRRRCAVNTWADTLVSDGRRA
jgi:hypothetical protein